LSESWELVMPLAKHMVWHFGLATILSVAVYACFKSWKWALLCFIASFYTDLDHLFEYSMAHGFSFDLKSIVTGQYFVSVDKRFLWLHSYETLILVWIWALLKKKSPAAIAFSLGFVGHLVIDQSTYPLKPLAYSLIYRYLNGFSPEAFGA